MNFAKKCNWPNIGAIVLKTAAAVSVFLLTVMVSFSHAQTEINPKDWFVLTSQSYWHYSGDGVSGGTLANDNTMTILSEKKDVGNAVMAARMKMTTDNPADNRNADEQFWYADPADPEGKLILYGLHNEKEDNMGSGKLSGSQDIVIQSPGVLIGKNGQAVPSVVESSGQTTVKTSMGSMPGTVNAKTEYREIIAEYDTFMGKFVNVLIMNIDIKVTVKPAFGSAQTFDVMVGDYRLKEGVGIIANNYRDLAVTQPSPKILDSGRVGAAGNPYIQPDSNVLGHCVIALQTVAGINADGADKLIDIDLDKRVGTGEAVYALQKIAGSRYFTVASSAFADSEAIPAKHSKDGGNLSPELLWTNPPTDAKSYVLTADDPDAITVAGKVWDHWIVYDIPADILSLPENAGTLNGANLPAGAKHGQNSWENEFYEGPAPPSGTSHRYYFRLYALNVTELNPASKSKSGIKAAMLGKIVGWTQIMGTYQHQ